LNVRPAVLGGPHVLPESEPKELIWSAAFPYHDDSERSIASTTKSLPGHRQPDSRVFMFPRPSVPSRKFADKVARVSGGWRQRWQSTRRVV